MDSHADLTKKSLLNFKTQKSKHPKKGIKKQNQTQEKKNPNKPEKTQEKHTGVVICALVLVICVWVQVNFSWVQVICAWSKLILHDSMSSVYESLSFVKESMASMKKSLRTGSDNQYLSKWIGNGSIYQHCRPYQHHISWHHMSIMHTSQQKNTQNNVRGRNLGFSLPKECVTQNAIFAILLCHARVATHQHVQTFVNKWCQRVSCAQQTPENCCNTAKYLNLN